MGTFYIVGAAEDEPEDMTIRSLRILNQAVLIASDTSADAVDVRRLLAHHGIATPLATLSGAGLSADIAHILESLQAGDVALLIPSLSPTPSALGHRLVLTALDHGFPVEPIPGPSLPVSALVLSGLPTESFRYLGEAPQQLAARRALLASVSAERRTLVLLAPSGGLAELLPDLADTLGERPLALMWAARGGEWEIWRGNVGRAPEEHLCQVDPAPMILVVGGAREQVARWDEACLRAAIQVRRNQGLGAKEISQQLAGESGWSRREIYRLAVGIEGFRLAE